MWKKSKSDSKKKKKVNGIYYLEINTDTLIPIIAFLFLLFISGFAIAGLLDHAFVDEMENAFYKKSMDVTSPEECKNLSLEETARCLNAYVIDIYNYTVRSEQLYTGDEGSIEDIIENGGDCYDYTMIYKKYFEELGFYTERPSIKSPSQRTGHTFLIVWDEDFTGYCHMDMRNYHCYRSL